MFTSSPDPRRRAGDPSVRGPAARPLSARASFERSPLGAFVRRYRRPLAAVSAGLAVLLAVSALKAPASDQATMAADSTSTLLPGEVAAPITLASAPIASSLAAGDVIDLVSVPRQNAGAAEVVARRARVIEVGESSGFASSASALIVVAVSESTALALADAGARADLTALIH